MESSMRGIPDIVIEGIIAAMEEGERLKTLSNKELVQERFMSECDELIVDEMCARLDPGCMKEQRGH